jgi:hypothetical protein
MVLRLGRFGLVVWTPLLGHRLGVMPVRLGMVVVMVVTVLFRAVF